MVNFVALDLETATSVKSSICQIGITEVIDGKVQPSKSWGAGGILRGLRRTTN